jgi:PPK2 family polyphosphate:nucleotide phosphotransferase
MGTAPTERLGINCIKEMKNYLVKPKAKVKLSRFNPNDSGEYSTDDPGEEKALQHTEKYLAKLDQLQELLYASATRALLIVLQGVDTSGKDGTIKHVMSGVNPQGCWVSSFKSPTALELSHDFLWRVHHKVPPKGYIGIFNRSHYEDVLITRVHDQISKKVEKQRYQEINDFEHYLSQNHVTILKFFLHISKDEQRERLQARIRDPQKRWKFNPNDLKERKLWKKYQKVYQDVLDATSTQYAPWYIIPANHKWYRNLVVSKIITETLEGLDLKFPSAPPGVDFKNPMFLF